ncbi:MAG: nucleotidyltransferase family protein [Bdellovibrionales bacterium]
MKFGLNPSQYEFILQKVIGPIRLLGAEVYCFGSRARGDHKSFSDLDLMIEGKKDQSLETKVAEIREMLTNSSFPFKVDLVFYEDFVDSYKADYQKQKALW